MKQLFRLFLLFASPVVATNEDAAKLANTKVYETEHISLVFERGLQEHIRPLAKEAEAFLADLAKTWSVILPKEKMRVTLGRGDHHHTGHAHVPRGPNWLSAGYDHQYKRIELRLEQIEYYEEKPVLRELQHQLVHSLLNRDKKYRLPIFMEEGLASYYSGHGTNDRFAVVVGFARTPTLQPWLNDGFEIKDRSEQRFTAAIGQLYIEWLWQKYPLSELGFLQTYLKGTAYQQALNRAGMGDLSDMVTAFEIEVRPNHKLMHLFMTKDFWVILLGMALLVWMGFRVYAAWLVARMPFQTIQPQAEEPDIALFSGPAFGQMMPELNPNLALRDAPTLIEESTRPLPGNSSVNPPPRQELGLEPTMPQANPFADIDDRDMDHLFGNLSDAASTIPATPLPVADDAPNPFADIDEELEGVFGNIDPSEPHTRHPMDHTESEEDDSDDEVDRIFGDWDVV